MNLGSRELFEELLTAEDFTVGYQPKGLSMYCKTEEALEEEKELIEISENLGQKAEFMTKEEAQEYDPGLELDISGAVFYPNDAFLAPHDFIHQLRSMIQARGGRFVENSQVTGIQSEGKNVVGLATETEFIEEFRAVAKFWLREVANNSTQT